MIGSVLRCLDEELCTSDQIEPLWLCESQKSASSTKHFYSDFPWIGLKSQSRGDTVATFSLSAPEKGTQPLPAQVELSCV